LRETDLTSVVFDLPNLAGADLRGSVLSKSGLNAYYDERTRWPEGFDPEAAGAQRVSD